MSHLADAWDWWRRNHLEVTGLAISVLALILSGLLLSVMAVSLYSLITGHH